MAVPRPQTFPTRRKLHNRTGWARSITTEAFAFDGLKKTHIERVDLPFPCSRMNPTEPLSRFRFAPRVALNPPASLWEPVNAERRAKW